MSAAGAQDCLENVLHAANQYKAIHIKVLDFIYAGWVANSASRRSNAGPS
jgi:hypothetical protein